MIHWVAASISMTTSTYRGGRERKDPDPRASLGSWFLWWARPSLIRLPRFLVINNVACQVRTEDATAYLYTGRSPSLRWSRRYSRKVYVTPSAKRERRGGREAGTWTEEEEKEQDGERCDRGRSALSPASVLTARAGTPLRSSG